VLQLGWIASWVEQISFWAGYSKVKHEENGVLVYGWRINYQLHAFFYATLPLAGLTMLATRVLAARIRTSSYRQISLHLAVLNNQDEDHSLSSDSGGHPGDLGGESDDGHDVDGFAQFALGVLLAVGTFVFAFHQHEGSMAESRLHVLFAAMLGLSALAVFADAASPSFNLAFLRVFALLMASSTMIQIAFMTWIHPVDPMSHWSVAAVHTHFVGFCLLTYLFMALTTLLAAKYLPRLPRLSHHPK